MDFSNRKYINSINVSKNEIKHFESEKYVLIFDKHVDIFASGNFPANVIVA